MAIARLSLHRERGYYSKPMRGRTTSRSVSVGAAVFLISSSALALTTPARGQNPSVVATVNRERAVSSARTAISPGVKYETLRVSGPNRVFMLTINPASAATMDVTTAGWRLPKFAQVSTMASRTTAVAAVNGDFGLPPGRPGHAYAEDGVFKQTSPLGVSGKNFSTRLDESTSYIGRPQASVDVTPEGTAPFTVDLWNQGAPEGEEIAGFTAFGGTLETPPKNACYVRLVASGDPNWLPGDAGIDHAYVVGEQICDGPPMVVGQDTVLVANIGTLSATTLAGLTVGQTVRLSWSLGWPGVTDTIGGSPILVDNGALAVTSSCNTSFCGRNPRTAIGIKSSGQIMLVVIDGRKPRYSVGMTTFQEAVFMKNHGAVWALNLDGGGSSTMWIKGQGVVNRPSDGNERAVSSAVLVLPGADPGEPLLGAAPTVPPAVPRAPSAADSLSGPRTRADAEAALLDPASTGGLLASLKRSGQHLSSRQQAWSRQFLAAQAGCPRDRC